MDKEEAAPEFDGIRSLSRLAVGIGTLAGERLMETLKAGEAKLAEKEKETSDEVKEGTARDGGMGSVIVGSAFEIERRIREGVPKAAEASAKGMRAAWLLMNMAGVSEVVRFAGRRVQPLRDAVASELGRLAQVGRDEEAHSRALLDTTSQEVINQTITGVMGRVIPSVIGSGEVGDFLKSQTTSITEKSLNAVRSMAAGADDSIEQRARALFRRPPLSEPSPKGGGVESDRVRA